MLSFEGWDVLYGGLGIRVHYNFWSKKFKKFVPAVNFFNFWSSKSWIRIGSGSELYESGSKTLTEMTLADNFVINGILSISVQVQRNRWRRSIDFLWASCGFDNYLLFFAFLRIRDVYPGPRILIFIRPGSRIKDPTTATKEEERKNLLSYIFVATNITKFKIILFLNQSQKYLFDNPVSEIQDPEKIYSGSRSRGQKGTGSRIRIRNTDVWICFSYCHHISQS